MHEMGIVQGILAASIEAAEKAGATRIKEIKITIGELTEIQEFALQFAFESLSPDTLAEGGRLTVSHLGAKSRCGQCGTEFEHGRFEIICPKCENFLCELIRGREMNIDAIDIDTPEDASEDATAHGDAADE